MMKKQVIILIAFLVVSSFQIVNLYSSSFLPEEAIEPNAEKNYTISVDDLSKRKEVSIMGSVGAGTDYQVLLTVTYDSDMQDDFDDLRYYDKDDMTELDYWIESYINSTSARVWVEVKDSLETNTTIWQYYGNSDLSTTSNGFETFEEFFDKTSTSGWSVERGMGVTTSGDYLRFYDPVGSGAQSIAQRYDFTTSINFQLMARYKTVSVSADDQLSIILADGTSSHRFGQIFTPRNIDQTIWSYYDGLIKEGGAWVEGTEFIFTIQVDGSDSSTGIDYHRYDTDWVFLDSVLGENFAYGSPTACDGIVLSTGTASAEIDANFKWIIFRKMIDTEPAVSGYSGEQSGADSILEDIFFNTDMIGYIGPLALIVTGWFLVKKDKGLGVVAFIVESLFVAQYLALVEATPDYWWQIFILLFGMLFTVVFPLWDR